MSASDDQSYYEIALTNRQVMSIFIVLLICILGAFLGGVWLGRDADTAVEVAAAQSISSAGPGEGQLEELDFFSRRGDAAQGAEGPEQTPPAPQASAGAAAAELPGSGNERPEEVEKRPVPATRPPVAQQVEPRVKPSTEPANARERKPVGGTGVASKVPDSVVIQVFSSNEEGQAQRVLDLLKKSGYPAVLSPVEVDGRTLHRVRIGPYTDSDEAQVVAESVQRAFQLETWITH